MLLKFRRHFEVLSCGFVVNILLLPYVALTRYPHSPKSQKHFFIPTKHQKQLSALIGEQSRFFFVVKSHKTLIIKRIKLIFSFGGVKGGDLLGSETHWVLPLWRPAPVWASDCSPKTPSPPAPAVTIRIPLRGIFPACPAAQLSGSWHYITTTTVAAPREAPEHPDRSIHDSQTFPKHF